MKLYIPDNRCIYSVLYDDKDAENVESISKIGPLEERVLNVLNMHNADLVTLFLRECWGEEGVITEDELLNFEKRMNSFEGMVDDYLSSVEYIRKRCNFIWDSHIFSESTGMDFSMLQFYQKWKTITDAKGFLYWTFKLIEWGGYDNPYPYTLYKLLTEGEFDLYYETYSEARKYFLPK